MSDRLSQILKELRYQLENVYKDRLINITLYGSQARGDAEPGSDIDILIILKGNFHPGQEISRIGPITSELSLNHNVVISCSFVSQDQYLHEQSPFLLNVRREGILV